MEQRGAKLCKLQNIILTWELVGVAGGSGSSRRSRAELAGLSRVPGFQGVHAGGVTTRKQFGGVSGSGAGVCGGGDFE